MSSLTTNPDPATLVATFVGCIAEPDDILEWRAIGDRSRPVRGWCVARAFNSQVDELLRLNADGYNIFVGVNPRPSSGASGNDCIQFSRCLFADFDGGATVPGVLEKIETFGLPLPTLVIASSTQGVHAYWRLDEPIDPTSANRLQRNLAATLGSDRAVCNAERVMRLPGFVNHKRADGARCELIVCEPSRVYELAEIVDRLPDHEDSPATPPRLDSLAAAHSKQGQASRNGATGVIDAFNARTPIDQLLIRGGSTPTGKPGHWWRPGKNAGHHSTIVHDGRSIHFSSNDPLNDGKFGHGTVGVHDAFDLYAALEHGGDVKQAVKAAAAMLGMSGTQRDPRSEPSEGDPAPPEPLTPIAVGTLCRDHKELKRVIVEGIARATEVVNLVSVSKVGKTYLAMALAICIAVGRTWLDTFAVTRCRVLYIDCELHRETLAKRIMAVANSLGVMSAELAEYLDVLPLRGRLRDLYALAPFFASLTPGKYGVIVLDALYRLTPPDFDENSNAAVTRTYNTIDRYAELTGSTFFIIHHASKGHQSGKAVIDVGSGAGAQSRAADTHVVLRPHAEAGVVVMEAAVRSFPPLSPLCLRWEFPGWRAAPELDPTQLAEVRPKRVKAEQAAVDPTPEPEPWTPARFATTFVTDRPQDKQTILARAGTGGLSVRKAEQLVRVALSDGMLHRWSYPKVTTVYLATVAQPVTATAEVPK